MGKILNTENEPIQPFERQPGAHAYILYIYIYIYLRTHIYGWTDTGKRYSQQHYFVFSGDEIL
jgi:hypothetical protein